MAVIKVNHEDFSQGIQGSFAGGKGKVEGFADCSNILVERNNTLRPFNKFRNITDKNGNPINVLPNDKYLTFQIDGERYHLLYDTLLKRKLKENTDERIEIPDGSFPTISTNFPTPNDTDLLEDIQGSPIDYRGANGITNRASLEAWRASISKEAFETKLEAWLNRCRYSSWITQNFKFIGLSARDLLNNSINSISSSLLSGLEDSPAYNFDKLRTFDPEGTLYPITARGSYISDRDILDTWVENNLPPVTADFKQDSFWWTRFILYNANWEIVSDSVIRPSVIEEDSGHTQTRDITQAEALDATKDLSAFRSTIFTGKEDLEYRVSEGVDRVYLYDPEGDIPPIVIRKRRTKGKNEFLMYDQRVEYVSSFIPCSYKSYGFATDVMNRSSDYTFNRSAEGIVAEVLRETYNEKERVRAEALTVFNASGLSSLPATTNPLDGESVIRRQHILRGALSTLSRETSNNEAKFNSFRVLFLGLNREEDFFVTEWYNTLRYDVLSNTPLADLDLDMEEYRSPYFNAFTRVRELEDLTNPPTNQRTSNDDIGLQCLIAYSADGESRITGITEFKFNKKFLCVASTARFVTAGLELRETTTGASGLRPTTGIGIYIMGTIGGLFSDPASFETSSTELLLGRPVVPSLKIPFVVSSTSNTTTYVLNADRPNEYVVIKNLLPQTVVGLEPTTYSPKKRSFTTLNLPTGNNAYRITTIPLIGFFTKRFFKSFASAFSRTSMGNTRDFPNLFVASRHLSATDFDSSFLSLTSTTASLSDPIRLRGIKQALSIEGGSSILWFASSIGGLSIGTTKGVTVLRQLYNGVFDSEFVNFTNTIPTTEEPPIIIFNNRYVISQDRKTLYYWRSSRDYEADRFISVTKGINRWAREKGLEVSLKGVSADSVLGVLVINTNIGAFIGLIDQETSDSIGFTRIQGLESDVLINEGNYTSVKDSKVVELDKGEGSLITNPFVELYDPLSYLIKSQSSHKHDPFTMKYKNVIIQKKGKIEAIRDDDGKYSDTFTPLRDVENISKKLRVKLNDDAIIYSISHDIRDD